MAGNDRLIIPDSIEKSLKIMESQSESQIQAAYTIRTSMQETYERLSKASTQQEPFGDLFWAYIEGYIEGIKSGIETENKVAFYKKVEDGINGI